MKKISLACLVLGIFASSAFANRVSFFDDTFSFSNNSVQLTTGVFEVRAGTFSGNVFTPFLGNALSANNTGYLDLETPEFALSFAQTNNNNVAAGGQIYLAFTLLPDGSAYSPSINEVILTDSTWLVPVFVSTPTPVISYTLGATTTAVKGTYSFNSGNQLIAVSSVPEPSSYAAIAGLAVLGLVASRRRRSV